MSNVFSKQKKTEILAGSADTREASIAGGPVQKPAATDDRLPWHPVAAITYAVFLYICSQVVAVLVLSLTLRALGWDPTRAKVWLSNDTFAQFLYVAIAEGLTVLGVVWFVRRKKERMRRIGWNRFRLHFITYSLAGFGLYFVGYLVTAALASAFVPSLNLNQQQDIGFQSVTTNVGLALTFVSLVILPPLAEETVFRGFIFGSLRGRVSFWPATIITSLLFAIPHLQIGEGAPLLWIAALDTLVLSLVLCYVRERSNSLWPGILIHGLKNGLAFVVLFLIK